MALGMAITFQNTKAYEGMGYAEISMYFQPDFAMILNCSNKIQSNKREKKSQKAY